MKQQTPHKYREATNLELRRLLRTADEFPDPEQALIKEEAKRRGLRSTTSRKADKQLAPHREAADPPRGLFDLKPLRRRKLNEEILDAPRAANPAVARSRDTLSYWFLAVLFFSIGEFVWDLWPHMGELSRHPVLSFRVWAVLAMLGLIWGLIFYHLKHGGYRGLALLSVGLGMSGVSLIATTLGYLWSGLPGWEYLLTGVFLPGFVIIMMTRLALSSEVANAFNVGKRFSQSYMIIGICISLFLSALLKILQFYTFVT